MQPQLQIISRENLLVLLESSGKKIEECEGECEIDTGRRIGADSIVSGEIQMLGKRYKLSLRLHDTHQGALLSSAMIFLPAEANRTAATTRSRESA